MPDGVNPFDDLVPAGRRSGVNPFDDLIPAGRASPFDDLIPTATAEPDPTPSPDDMMARGGEGLAPPTGPVPRGPLPTGPGYDSEAGRITTGVSSFGRGVADVAAGLPKAEAIMAAQGVQAILSEFDRIDAADERGERPGILDFAPRDRVSSFAIGDIMRYREADPAARAALRAKYAPGADPRDRASYKAGEWISEKVKRALPVNPEFAEEWLATKIPQGLGSAVGFMGLGVAGRAIGAPTMLAPAAGGSALAASGQFEDALANGASIEDAFKAANIAAAVGTSEALPIGRLLDRLDRGTGGSVRRLFVEAFRQGGEEMVQEVGMTIASNLIASDLVGYDPERGTFTGTGEAAGVGFTVGALMQTIGGLLSPGGRRGAQPPPASQQPGQISAPNGNAAPSVEPAAPPRPSLLTPDDRASPLPDPIIDDGKRIIEDALAGRPIDVPPAAEPAAVETIAAETATTESPGPDWRPLYSDATRAEQIGWTNPTTGEARMIAPAAEMPQPSARPVAEQAGAAPTVPVSADQASPAAVPARTFAQRAAIDQPGTTAVNYQGAQRGPEFAARPTPALDVSGLRPIDPVAAQQLPAEPRPGGTLEGMPQKAKPRPRRNPVPLIQWIRDQGGIDPDDPNVADIRANLDTAAFRLLGRRATAQTGKGGRGLDYIREAAVENGYLPEGADINDLLDAIRRDAFAQGQGQPRVVSDYDIGQQVEIDQRERERREADRYINRFGNLDLAAEYEGTRAEMLVAIQRARDQLAAEDAEVDRLTREGLEFDPSMSKDANDEEDIPFDFGTDGADAAAGASAVEASAGTTPDAQGENRGSGSTGEAGRGDPAGGDGGDRAGPAARGVEPGGVAPPLSEETARRAIRSLTNEQAPTGLLSFELFRRNAYYSALRPIGSGFPIQGQPFDREGLRRSIDPDRVLVTDVPVSAAQVVALDLLPATPPARLALMKEAYAAIPGAKPGRYVLLDPKQRDRGYGVAITRSAKGGAAQLTFFDRNGFSGDQQHKSIDEALADAIGMGFVDPAPDALNDLLGTEEFQAGNAKSTAAARPAPQSSPRTERTDQGDNFVLGNDIAGEVTDADRKAAAERQQRADAEKEMAVKARQQKLRRGGQQSVDDLGIFNRQTDQVDMAGRQAAAEPKPVPAEPKSARPADYGANNKLVTSDRAALARDRLRAKLRDQLSAGIDPEIMAEGAILAVFHVEAGARKFTDFARAVIGDLGDGARPFLRMWYNAARDYPGVMSGDMTPYQDVAAADLDAVLQENSDVSDRSEGVESDSGDAAAPDGVGAADVPASAGRTEQGARSGGRSGGGRGGRRSAGGAGVSVGDAPAVGTQGDQSVSDGKRFIDSSPAADRDGAGSGERGVDGPAIDEHATEPARDTASGAAGVEARRAAQRKAETVPVRPGIDNIRQTLPMLLDGQQDDVAFAETRFSKPDGHGVLFTNGTGTGKTFSGLGIIKRFARQGKGDILIVAPSQDILKSWVAAAKDLGIDISTLDSTTDVGAGIVATTYANLGENQALADRSWDLVVADEAHNLSSNAAGEETGALAHLRAITNHPSRLTTKADMILRDDLAAAKRAADDLKSARMSDDQRQWDRINELEKKSQALWSKYQEAKDQQVAKARGEPRSKVVFLSATPFAYDKSVDLAEGYLFQYPEAEGRGYNEPDGRGAFMMQHFGYRMRTGKLTQPEAGVNSEVMERAFHQWLRDQGSLSGRRLEVEADYDRKFVLVDDAIGNQIQQALNFLMEADDGKFRPLHDAIMKRFDYLARMRLLEALKANHAVDYIRQQQALGRKVVVFHNYNTGGGFDPFAKPPSEEVVTVTAGGVVKYNMDDLYAEFVARNSYVQRLNFSEMPAPIDTLTAAFPGAMVYNGTVPNKQRTEGKRLFNEDGNGRDLIIIQSDAGQAGISLHDTTGKHQRVLVNLGMPTRPVAAIQQEGRIYRTGQVTDAVMRYFNTGTDWERWTFASKIAERAGTAENLALGNEARALKQSFIDAFNESDTETPGAGDGKGGKQRDRAENGALTAFEKAKAFYFAQQKNTKRRDQREGIDYFATPEPVGLKMVEWAGVRFGDRVLEPSAGHGAIARFFPEGASRTIIEPSSQIASRAALAAPGAKVITDRFENHNVVNKYDAIIMNPPYGLGGKTAIEHLAKAYTHLRNGGRIVALIPDGGAATKRFDAFMDSEAAKGLYLVRDVAMPSVTFERAGTKVVTRIVVLEKQTDADVASQIQQASRDYRNAETIKDLFDRIEDSEAPARLEPKTVEVLPLDVPEAGRITAGGIEFQLSSEGRTQIAQPKGARLGPQRFSAMARLAEANGGNYERGARGFTFETVEDRAAFLGAVENPPEVAPVEAATASLSPDAFNLAETVHGKTGDPLFVASPTERVDRDEYNRIVGIAKANGGWYSSFRGNGAVPGYQFKSADARRAFLDQVTGAAPKAGSYDLAERQTETAARADAFTDAVYGPPTVAGEKARAAVEQLLARIAPGAQVRTPDRLLDAETGTDRAFGLYIDGVIHVALAGPSATRTARHEAIHYLRQAGIISDLDWRALTQAARDGDWIGRHRIRERYARQSLTESQMIEEAIAEGYAEWAAGGRQAQNRLLMAMRALKRFFDQVRAAIRRAIGRNPDFRDLFSDIETGRAGREEARSTGSPFADMLRGMASRYLPAFHGSPHDFDRFSLSKIGTGEGAQAYGWGLYFASRKEIAEFYRQSIRFNTNELEKVANSEGLTGDAAVMLAHQFSTGFGGKRFNEWLDALSEYVDDAQTPERSRAAMRQILDKRVEASSAVSAMKTDGRLYEVELSPEPEHLLDWDKPLAEQSEYVRERLEQAGTMSPWKVTETGWMLRRKWRIASDMHPESDRDNGREFDSRAAAEDRATYNNTVHQSSKSGQDAYEALSERLAIEAGRVADADIPGSPRGWGAIGPVMNDKLTDDRAASLSLLEAGIPGLRYLDAGSRSRGDGAHNYVIFDENAVEVRAKYDLPDLAQAERRAVSRLTPQDRALIEQHLAPAGGGLISRIAKSAFARDIARNGIADTLVTRLINQLNPIFAYEMRAETAAGRTAAIRDASVSAAKMAEFTMNSSGRTWAMFHVGPLRYNAAEGIVEADGTGKGLFDIFKYLSDPDTYDKFRLYASARRGQRMMTEGRERNLTQAAIDRGLAMADDVGAHKGATRTFREIFDDYQAFNAALLNGMGRDTGLLSQESIDLWLEHADYVPFYREIDEGEVPSAAFLRKNINKPDPGIKTLEGGKQRIADLMDNVARNAEAIVRAGMRNVTMRRIYELAEVMGEGQIVQEGSAEDGVLTYRVNGNEVKFTVDDPALVTAVAAMRPDQHSGLYKALTEIASFFRNGIVASPAFMLRNLVRGTTAGFVQTGKNIGMAGWVGTGLVRALRNDRTIQEMKAISGTGAYTFGGAGSDIGALMRRQTGAQRDLMPIAVVRKTWGVLEKFGEATELADREAIYSNLIREGKTKAEAAYQAMNLINYSRRGSSQSLRVLLPLVPFLNARIQGLYRMAETQTTGPERAKKLMGVAARGLVLTAVSAALYAMNGDDERYDDEPLHRKLNYYILYAGDTRILIPKAFEFGAIFSSIPELIMDAVAQKEGKRLAEGLAHTLLNTFAFNPIPQPALPILENIANYSFFTGRELENQRLQNLPAAQRYTAATPRVLREIGRMTDLSPVKMENLIRGYTGTMGMSLLAGLDSIGRAAGVFPSEPTGAFGDFGMFSDALEDQIGSMVRVGPDRASRWVGDLYEMSRDVNQAYREAKSLAAEGDIEAARRLAIEEGVGARKFLNKRTRALGDLNKLIRQVEDDPTLSGLQKRAQLNRLYERRNTIAETAVKAVKGKVDAFN